MAQPPAPGAERCVWFHAAGEAEAISGLELLRRLREEDDSIRCVLTTEAPLPEGLRCCSVYSTVEHGPLPTDGVKDAQVWLEEKKPQILIWTGPFTRAGLLQKAQQVGVRLIFAESADSTPNGRRRKDWRSTATRAQLRRFSLIYCASQETAHSYEQLGASKLALHVSGALEEGSIHLPGDDLQYRVLSSALAARPIWLAGRTTASEEALLSDVHRRITRMSHRLLLIVAPDTADRMAEAAAFFTEAGWRVVLHEPGHTPAEDTQVLIGAPEDLGLWYRLSPVTFMGGTLSGTGGAHPFAPATLGSAILYGNQSDPFQASYARLVRGGAARLVLNADGLEVNLRDLQAADKVAQMANAAWEICSRGAEVTDRIVADVLDLLDGVEVQHARA
ncbi:3-deoxy-D-manno-octulosonic acid transferase [Pseudoruegeria sp. SHC-113]|uniref:3-deoxy-D-manno-octulosonic acid transferase n=1 Tax=Pseudoruegeria sp. SHC-113 TaxID=2855439 RepID=UPI0021BB1367|nr:glycosyltransferase N-terminal domain-containing protein [Pseudoruegeria sp. SHC-113]MCT8158491.1 hypothetical protein [Pseudoruegeria sp. SHC-113]